MNLKNFHIVFISVATLLCGFCLYWGLQREDVLGTSFVIVSLLGIVALLFYGVFFVKKMRRLKDQIVFVLVFGSATLHPFLVQACTSCFSATSESGSLQMRGVRLSVFFLLGVVFFLLTAFGGFVAFLIRCEKKGAL